MLAFCNIGIPVVCFFIATLILRSSYFFYLHRRNCFINDEFVMCLRATERLDEADTFMGWISQLNAGRK